MQINNQKVKHNQKIAKNRMGPTLSFFDETPKRAHILGMG